MNESRLLAVDGKKKLSAVGCVCVVSRLKFTALGCPNRGNRTRE